MGSCLEPYIGLPSTFSYYYILYRLLASFLVNGLIALPPVRYEWTQVVWMHPTNILHLDIPLDRIHLRETNS